MSNFNKRCAERGERMIEAFNEDRQDSCTDDEGDLTDIFTDLMHYGKENGIDYEACFNLARVHFIAEDNDPEFNEESGDE